MILSETSVATVQSHASLNF